MLAGQSIATAAADYGLSVPQVKPILNNYCRRANPAAYRSLQPGRRLCDISISVLRVNRNRFLPLPPAFAQLSKWIAIWCLPGVPAITMSGMYDAEIDTIEDLLKIPIKALSRLPKVGPDGFCRTMAALRSHGFVEQTPETDRFRTSCSGKR